MWYDNNIFTGTVCLTIVACLAIWLIPSDADKVVNTAIGAIGGFVSGYVAKTIKDATTTVSRTTTEEISNVGNDKKEGEKTV